MGKNLIRTHTGTSRSSTRIRIIRTRTTDTDSGTCEQRMQRKPQRKVRNHADDGGSDRRQRAGQGFLMTRRLDTTQAPRMYRPTSRSGDRCYVDIRRTAAEYATGISSSTNGICTIRPEMIAIASGCCIAEP